MKTLQWHKHIQLRNTIINKLLTLMDDDYNYPTREKIIESKLADDEHEAESIRKVWAEQGTDMAAERTIFHHYRKQEVLLENGRTEKCRLVDYKDKDKQWKQWRKFFRNRDFPTRYVEENA